VQVFWNEHQQQRRRRVGVDNWKLSEKARANLEDMQRQAEIDRFLREQQKKA
jgi:hypothetical protein